MEEVGKFGQPVPRVGEVSLAKAHRQRPLPIQLFLDIAVQLTEAMARLHESGIVHGAISPVHVVWNPETGVASLCGSADTDSAQVPNRADAGGLETGRRYMAPEQTGRTGLEVDWRVDLYSMGATFYEMLTGIPPFQESDALALSHAQIARNVRPPTDVNGAVPLMLSRIVVRLLEKEPAHRYQAAATLLEDLREASQQWTRSGAIQPFVLAAHEVPRELSIPDRLYGRDDELRALGEAFQRARAGARELVLVSGGPGIGKSALVDQLCPVVEDAGGYFAAGKFDQLQRSVPFSGLAQALRGLVRQLLTASEEDLDGWRRRIDEAVAPNGQLLVSLVPELEGILGPQPEVAEVGPVESRNRFQLLIARFLGLFAQPEHPFVLFLDDLQWVDAASLQLVMQCAGDPASHHLMVIGAYRDGEVTPSHALALAVSALRETGADIQTIHLEPLGIDAVAHLSADTVGEDVARLQVLAELIIRKSAGNPFFVRRLLHLMHAEGLIRFSADSRRWQWDESEIERAPISDNVLDVMVTAINRLPEPTKRLLETGACIGHRFDVGTLAELTDLDPAALSEGLWPAIEDGLLVKAHDAFHLTRQRAVSKGDTANAAAVLQFSHDRVQQAAYGMLTEGSRAALHHVIGRRLLERAGARRDEKLFEIVDQFNLGEDHVVDAAERATLIELNLAAGSKAKESAAHRAAFEYFSVAKRLLGPNVWLKGPDMAFTVHRELAESAYLAGEHSTAEALVETSLEHAPSKAAKAELYGLRVLAATVASDWKAALHWGREGLLVFEQAWPLEGLAEAIQAEATAVVTNLDGRGIEGLVNEPEVEDDDIRASMRLLSLLGAPAYFSGDPVLTFLVSRSSNLSLLHGPSAHSAFGYVLFAGIHNAITGQFDVGYAFGRLALALAERFGNRAEQCRTLEVYGVLVHHWKAPLRDGLPLLREGFQAGIESGEFPFAAFNLNSILINGLPAGLTLNEMLDEAEVAVDFATTQKNRTSVEIALPFRQFARAVTGATPRPTSFDDDEFEEASFLEAASGHATALGHYWVTRLQLSYLLGDFEQALTCSEEAAKRIASGITGMITSAEYVFYTALTLAATSPGGRSDVMPTAARLRELHDQLRIWESHCPTNFTHKVALVGAEIARVEGRPADAVALYRAAIADAERQQFVQDEALAHELRARFLLDQQEPAFAATHLQLALDRYRRWGASAKVLALEAQYPHSAHADLSAHRPVSSIDHAALIKASQAISSETVPERLFEQVLRVVVEVAGAQRGVLALMADGALRVRAQIEVDGTVSMSVTDLPLDQCSEVPSAVLRYVQRTKEYLLMADAGAAGLFTRDPVIRRRQVRSVLCVPLLKQSVLVGLIYLENNAMAGAFAAELVEIGKVLSAQAVISLENSSLLKRMQELTGDLEQRVSERTRQLTDEIAARDKAEAALREADRQKDEFLAMLAHELRNPLAAISNASELLSRTKVTGADGMSPLAALLQRQTKQLNRLIDDMLDLSRISRGQISLEQLPVEVSSLVHQAAESVQSLVREKAHRLVVAMPAHALYVRGDRARLVQAISNILHNAAKYTDKGGEIYLEVFDSADEVGIKVRDNGSGIAAGILPSLFDLFVQGERTLDRSQGGLGIGLSVVKRLVEMHHGTVKAASAGVGQGSTFTICLPRISAPHGGSEAESMQAAAVPRRVLIVDDNADAADSLATLLELEGHQVFTVYGAADALDAASRLKPDVMLLDIGLPEMDGYEVARRLRTQTELSTMRLVALTGYGQKEDRSRALAAGFDDHLVKPLAPESLTEILAVR